MKPLLLILIFANFFKGEAQTISFSKLMTYYISQDEQLILNDLRAKKYIIEKERKADVEFFDTQITCFKSPDGKPSSLAGIMIFKNAGSFYAINYFTLNKQDFYGKLKEVTKRGFELTTEDTTSQWLYQKGDTVIAAEKKYINAGGKKFLRYELGVVLRPNDKETNQKLFLFVSPTSRRRFFSYLPTSFSGQAFCSCFATN